MTEPTSTPSAPPAPEGALERLRRRVRELRVDLAPYGIAVESRDSGRCLEIAFGRFERPWDVCEVLVVHMDDLHWDRLHGEAALTHLEDLARREIVRALGGIWRGGRKTGYAAYRLRMGRHDGRFPPAPMSRTEEQLDRLYRGRASLVIVDGVIYVMANDPFPSMRMSEPLFP